MDKYLKHIIGTLAGIIALIIYISTLHPGVGFIDCGELAAACYTFGVPHPTGYPLFLIISFLFSHLPFGGTAIYKLNLLSSIESSLAVVVIYYNSRLLLNNIVTAGTRSKEKKPQNPKSGKKESAKVPFVFTDRDISIISFFTAIMLGLSRTFWFDATEVEVYALHSLFISLIVYFCTLIAFNISSRNKKTWALLFLILGLSLANHSTTIYFIPGIIYLWYLQFKENKEFGKSVLVYLVLLIPGALMYFILMVVASSQPFLNWSDPSTFSGLINHMRGNDFSQLMFSSESSFTANLKDFFKNVPVELSIIPGIIGLAGLIFCYINHKKLFIFFILLILTCLGYSLNYSTVEIQSFYLLIYHIIILCASLGVWYIAKKMYEIMNVKAMLSVIIIGIIACGFSFNYNYKVNNNSSNYANDDITVNMLQQLEPNSILIMYEYSYSYSAALYYQQVEKIRGDVKVFNVRFLSVPWYLNTIKKYYPDVYDVVRTEADEYIKTFNVDDASHPQKLTAFVKVFISKIFSKYPVYFTYDFVINKEVLPFITDYYVPASGLAYKMRKKNSAYDESAGLNSLQYNFRKYPVNDSYTQKTYISTAGVYFDNALYHYNNKNNATAIKFLDKALELNSSFKEALDFKTRILKESKTP